MLDTLTRLCYYGVCTIVVRWAFCALWPVPLAQSQRTTAVEKGAEKERKIPEKAAATK